MIYRALQTYHNLNWLICTWVELKLLWRVSYWSVSHLMSGTEAAVNSELLMCFTSHEWNWSCCEERATEVFHISYNSFANCAFGMGVDTSKVWLSIHCGLPHDTEEYLQETGRAGRDGETAYALLLYGKGQTRFIDQYMKEYCENKCTCRCDFLFKDFDEYSHNPINVGCHCCDICACTCKCQDCSVHHAGFILLQ